MIGPEAPRDAAAVSYFSLIALFPSVLVIIALVEPILGRDDLLVDSLIKSIAGIFPGSRDFMRKNLEELLDPSPAVVLSCTVVVLWSTTWIFSFLENALNSVWGVSRRRSFLESRLRSIGLMAMGGILLLVSTLLTMEVTILRRNSTDSIPAFEKDPIISALWSSILLVAGVMIAVVAFTLIYKLMPDRKSTWAEATSGGILAAAMWEVGAYVFVHMVRNFNYERVYGRTGAIILLLAWVYTSNLIILFGANFSALLHRPAAQPFEDRTRAAEQLAAGAGIGGRLRRFPPR